MRANLHAVPSYRPTPADIEREYRMTEILRLMKETRNREAKRAWWREYQQLHEQRPIEYVEYLERKRGLR